VCVVCQPGAVNAPDADGDKKDKDRQLDEHDPVFRFADQLGIQQIQSGNADDTARKKNVPSKELRTRREQ